MELTEKEMHYWVAVKWYYIWKELLKGKQGDVVEEAVRNKFQILQEFQGECAYCEKYANRLENDNLFCESCPLGIANQNCHYMSSWYFQADKENPEYAYKIYELARRLYKECV